MRSGCVRPMGVAFCLLCFAAVGRAEGPERVSPCDLQNNPGAYNHKLIEVTAFVSHGFEDFTLVDPACSAWPQVWLEYGGTVTSRTIYCCGVTTDRSRPKPLQVEDVSVPLVVDQQFREFDRLLQRLPDSIVRATLVGRFFSGRQHRSRTGVTWGGYGHMGCCSLLAVQQVLHVDPQTRTDLDYRASAETPEMEGVGCGYRYLLPVISYDQAMAAQREAERGNAEWTYTDPQRVSSTSLAKLLNMDPARITRIRQTRKSQGRLVYEWLPAGTPKRYLMVVSRPYWLSFYATEPKRIPWVLIAAYESSCD